jgi:NAD+ kinase
MVCRRIGLIVHRGRPAAVAAGEVVRAWAAERGVPVAEMDVWEDGGGARRSAHDEAEVSGHPDLIVTIGGDGTFLRGVRIAVQDDAPVLGVNVGRVGFLTEIEPAEIAAALTAYGEDRMEVESRLLLGLRASRPLSVPEGIQELLRYGRGAVLAPPLCRPDTAGRGVVVDVTAVNDIVLEKLARDRQASIGVYVGGRLFASYSADALVVASPTGSTAYSFAAGGPVLSPRLRALVFTPVAPHMAFNRSLIMSADEAVGLRVLDHSGQVALSVDGQLRAVLDPGDWISVHPSDRTARLLRLRPSDFYGRLRDRFALADAPAASADGSPPALFEGGA